MVGAPGLRAVVVASVALAAAACHVEHVPPLAPDAAADVEPVQLVPTPRSMTIEAGALHLAADVRIVTPVEGTAVAELLAAALRPATGFALPVVVEGDPRDGDIAFKLDDALERLGLEGYQLIATGRVVTVRAFTAAGLFYGTQTLRQLLPAEIGRAEPVSGVDWKVPRVDIEDAPRYRWRGVMLDVARHFFDVPTVERIIDLAAYHKLNRLHLHLTDDQGWRIQIDSWPALTAIGGSTQVGGGAGGFYTKADYAALIAYAHDRFVTVVPEIDMPGHTNAALASYGELNPDGQPRPPYTGTGVGISSLWLDGPSTARFVEEVLGEVMEMTPGAYIHVGGDEAAQTPPAPYVAFLEKVHRVVATRGKTLIGWEEIARADLHQGSALAQHWVDRTLADAAEDQGARIIASPAGHTYLDMRYDADTPVGQSWVGLVDVGRAYSWDPETELVDVRPTAIEGVEAPLWTETVATPADIDLLMFPRLCGHAEIAWSLRQGRDWSGYRPRLAAHGRRLEALGVGFYRSRQIDWGD